MEENLEKRLLSGVLAMCLFFALLATCSSCGVPEQLTSPVHSDKVVAWCNEDYVYVWKDGFKTEMDSIKNKDNWMLAEGDVIIVRDAFRVCFERY